MSKILGSVSDTIRDTVSVAAKGQSAVGGARIVERMVRSNWPRRSGSDRPARQARVSVREKKHEM